jgi:endoglucanase
VVTIARRLLLLSALCLAPLIVPAVAGASSGLDVRGFHLSSAALITHENVGSAQITVERSNALMPAQIRYGIWHLTAVPNTDYTPVGGRIDFAAGQSSATFSIPIVDHGTAGPPKTLTIGLYGASPIGLGLPSQAVLTILNDDPISVTKILENPLGLLTTPPATNPLNGARLFVDRLGTPAASYADHIRRSNPGLAATLDVIGSQPQVYRFGAWSGQDPSVAVSNYLNKADKAQPGTVPMISTYRLLHPSCHGYADSPAAAQSYEDWMTKFAQGISTHPAIVFLEMDALITTGCLSRHGLAVRMAELKYAGYVLSQLPRTVVYLDAGAADALPAGKAAQLLRHAGVAQIQGFFLNSTHFDWTSHEMAYGQKISRMTGGKHFVVSTAANGRGPLVPRNRVRSGNEVLCNPPGRGLGPKPTTNTGYRNVDMFAWIGNPGRSGGACVPGAPGTGQFWPAYALMLVRNADFRVR